MHFVLTADEKLIKRSDAGAKPVQLSLDVFASTLRWPKKKRSNEAQLRHMIASIGKS
jgi:hypothetical protein